MPDKRVRTGCATCRRRRIKCDEARPTCERCRNANFHCEGYTAPRRLSNASSASLSVFSKRGSASPSSKNSTPSPPDTSSFPEISLRHKDWRREQLPLYHHFVTTTVVRLFRKDHVGFWRDQVVQMSHGMDLVYEALLAIGAVHRSSLIACQAGNGPESVRFKLLGFRAYGKVIQLLPEHLARNTLPDVFASMVVLMLLAYFECFLEAPKAAFRHLWAAIRLFRDSEPRFSEKDMSHVVPIFDAMLRLDHLAQTLVPYANSSFLRFSDQAFMEPPFWNRLDPTFSGSSQLDRVAAERYRLIQLVGAHNKLTRIVWSCWCPGTEWPNREELMGFCAEMMLWKANSPATYANYDAPDESENAGSMKILSPSAYNDFGVSDSTNKLELGSLLDPTPYFFPSNEAALNAAMYNDYLGCAYSMISARDDDPTANELEAFDLVYENLRIAAGLIQRHNNWERSGSPYKPCDAVSMGITTFLSHGARRCFSGAWQKWTISALRQIGREGLSNGHTAANMVEILRILEANALGDHAEDDDRYLGHFGDRLMPLLMPRGEDERHMAFYLKHFSPQFDGDEATIQVVAKASWRQEASGQMHSLKLEDYNFNILEGGGQDERPEALELFDSWRQEVEKGWHGYLSNEIQDGFLRKEYPVDS